MQQKIESYDIVVCGGGLAGFCAAVAAARHGAKTCLVQDRPVLGGNSSSEIRVLPNGAATFHTYARETGIISELLIEERTRNHQELFGMGSTNSVWDMVLYDMAVSTPNLTLHLNTAVEAVEMGDSRQIKAVLGRVANAELRLRLEAALFIDCTGDGMVAVMVGCDWRMGTEGQDEFGEPHAPPEASDDVMGSSLLFRARDMGRPAPFKAPAWAVSYDDASFFYDKRHTPRPLTGGYWWMELSIPWHTIYDNETLRHELTRHVLGVWDWIKNKDPKLKDAAANYAFEWVGQVPGKRESRRIMGRYLMTEHDPLNKTVFEDEVAFGGWYVDLHTAGGLLAVDKEPTGAEGGHFQASAYMAKSYCGPYGIPLRTLIANDVDNLMMAGRNVSVTHAALGTVRVQGTTALMGQAAGTAAATALKRHLPIQEVPDKAITDVQQALLRDGCFLPNTKNQDKEDLARYATVSASSEAYCTGVGPESRSDYGGMGIPDAQALVNRHDSDRLHQRRGQWIAIGSDQLDEVAVCLSNLSDEVQIVEAELLEVDHIWDHRIESLKVLTKTQLELPPGRLQWLTWPLKLSLPSGRYVRLDLGANPHVQWHTAGALEPGHPCAFQIGSDSMRGYGARYQTGWSMSFRVSPPQASYGPANVLSGITRPYSFTNLWRSDPEELLPQWVELSWPKSQTIRQVELTFPGNLFSEFDNYPPFYRDPQCPKSFSLSVCLKGTWQEVAQIDDNYQRLRAIQFDSAMLVDKLRLTIHATNGDRSAGLYEIRCYT